MIYDSTGSVHHFYEEDNTLKYIFADGITKKVEQVDFAIDVKEFDGFIDADDVIFILCVTTDKKLILYEMNGGEIKKNSLSDKISNGVNNIHIFGSKNDINIIYAMQDDKERHLYTLMHSRFYNNEWQNKEIIKYISTSIPNEIKVFEDPKGYFAAFIETDGTKSLMHLCQYDGVTWKKDIFVIETNFQLYWFDIKKEQSYLEFVYTYENKGNFSIRYEKYDLINKKEIVKHDLIGSSNNMHPIFLDYLGQRWIIWMGYGSVMSCRLLDEGMSYDGPFKWKESTSANIMLHKFSYNNQRVKEKLKMKGRSVFSTIPEYIMIGFGDYKTKAEPVQIAKKKDDTRVSQQDDAEMIHKQRRHETELKSTDLITKIEEMETRIENIEYYLTRRRRNMFRK